MLFLKSTSVTKAPGIYEVDVAAKPPGKTFGIFMATDPDNPPSTVLAELTKLGFYNTYQQAYTHKDKGKVLDMHFQKNGTDLFNGWKTEECAANLAAIDALFGSHGIKVAPRVMSLAEAYA
jgi:pyruvate dehydrogenase complex dehydrogenase (E1) component